MSSEHKLTADDYLAAVQEGATHIVRDCLNQGLDSEANIRYGIEIALKTKDAEMVQTILEHNWQVIFYDYPILALKSCLLLDDRTRLDKLLSIESYNAHDLAEGLAESLKEASSSQKSEESPNLKSTLEEADYCLRRCHKKQLETLAKMQWKDEEIDGKEKNQIADHARKIVFEYKKQAVKTILSNSDLNEVHSIEI